MQSPRIAVRAIPGLNPLAEYIFNDAPIGMALLSLKGRFLKVNQAFSDFTGFPAGNLIGRTFLDITHPDDRRASREINRKLLEADTPISGFEKRYIHKGGRIVWGSVSLRIVRDRKGTAKCVIAQIADITARKEMEDALKASEERYKVWLQAIPMLAWRCDAQGKCIDCNQRWLHYTGNTLEEVRGDGWMRAVHPEDRTRVLKKVRDDVTGGEFYECEYRLRRASDGAYRWHLARAVPLKDMNGNILMWLGAAPDIDDLKRLTEELKLSETRFRIALRGSPITVFSQDRNLIYTWAYNPSSGFRIEDVLGKKDHDLYPAADARLYTRIKRQVLKTGISRQDEVVAHTKTGEGIFDMTTEALRDQEGRIIGVICAAVDITGRKQIEKEILSAHDQLELKVRERTAKLRTLALELTQAEQKERRRIAHILHEDLQQHLVAMQYKLQELQAEQKTGPISNTSRWLLGEITQTIQISRDLTSQLRPPVLYEFGLRPALDWLARDIHSRFGFKAAIKGLHTFKLESDEMSIFAFEAVRELLMNAIKHSGVKTASLSISRGGTSSIVIEVRDRGTGFNLNKMTPGRFGLFSLRERADAVGGNLQITSRRGHGTTATLTLPVI